MKTGTPRLRRRALLALSLLAAGLGPMLLAPQAARAEAAKVHTTRGIIKAFAPERAHVSIAHEEIPGFMMAMTMTFEPRTADQLAGLAVGDRVDFSFEVTPEGRRPLVSIAKRAPDPPR